MFSEVQRAFRAADSTALLYAQGETSRVAEKPLEIVDACKHLGKLCSINICTQQTLFMLPAGRP